MSAEEVVAWGAGFPCYCGTTGPGSRPAVPKHRGSSGPHHGRSPLGTAVALQLLRLSASVLTSLVRRPWHLFGIQTMTFLSLYLLLNGAED